MARLKASAPVTAVDDIVATASKQAAVDAEARQGIVAAMSLLGYDVNSQPVSGTTRVTVTTLSAADTGDLKAATLRRAAQDHKLAMPKAPAANASADIIIKYASDYATWATENKRMDALVGGVLVDNAPTVYPVNTRYSAVPTNRTSVGGNYSLYCIASDGIKGSTDVLSDRVESHMVRDGKAMPLFFRHRSNGTITVAVTPEQAANDLDALTKAIETAITKRYLALCKIQDRRQAIKAATASVQTAQHA